MEKRNPKDKLAKNIADQIKEAQLKLGFVRETMRLYYPLESMQAIMDRHGVEADPLCRELEKEFPGFSFGQHEERIEVCVPPSYVERIHKEMETPAFLAELVGRFRSNHHLTKEQLQEIFAHHGDFVCEEMPEGADFDFVFYFLDSSVDEYYYCVRMEMGHTIYHRFLKTDYQQLLS